MTCVCHSLIVAQLYWGHLCTPRRLLEPSGSSCSAPQLIQEMSPVNKRRVSELSISFSLLVTSSIFIQVTADKNKEGSRELLPRWAVERDRCKCFRLFIAVYGIN